MTPSRERTGPARGDAAADAGSACEPATAPVPGAPRLFYSEDGIELWCGDCRPWLGTLEAGSVDLVLTDPPYGIGYKPGGNGVAVRRVKETVAGDDAPFDPSHLLRFPRLILWGANHYASRLPESRGWLVWVKTLTGGMSVLSEAELAWTNCAAKVKMFQHLWSGAYRASERDFFVHPTQKPVALMLWCLKVAGGEGLVVDPYAGSGPVLVACKMLGRPVRACELSPAYCATAAKRLRDCPRPLFTLETPEPIRQGTLEYAP